MKEDIKFVSQMEQLETASVQVALVVSSYYKELLKVNVPEELASKLTLQFHDLLWRKLTRD